MNRLWFLLGFAMMPVLVVLLIGATRPSWADPNQTVGAITMLLLLTLPTSLGVIELVTMVSPRCVFDLHARSQPRLTLIGLASGGAMVASSISWATVYEQPNPIVMCGAFAAVWTLVPALLMRQVTPGRCRHCDYDLTDVGRVCPECGEIEPRPSAD
ncbi:MAG: hypothetical protein KDA28_13095 [Phycisphaerales bacterium]|nr:hypothetical protein [Phycisphaerales bacterium]